MRIVVVEDETPAREKLVAAIRAVEPGATIAATLAGVAETVAWLERNPRPDLLFLDIQLSDGLGFDILRSTEIDCPVIFATAYDEYLLDAFDSNGIDYLLKPVREDRLAAAIGKYRRLRDHFTSGQAALIERISRERSGRERLLVRKGNDYISLKVSEIAWVRSAEKLTFLMTGAGVQYLLDRSLAELEAELDSSRFFRTNRAWLVAIDAVIRCRQYGKGRLLLDLAPRPAGEEVVVSQERAAAFRKWLGQ